MPLRSFMPEEEEAEKLVKVEAAVTKLPPEEIEAMNTPGRSRFEERPYMETMEVRPWHPRAGEGI